MGLSDQLNAPFVLTPGKRPHCPSDRKLGGRQSLSERPGEENNFGRTGIHSPTLRLVKLFRYVSIKGAAANTIMLNFNSMISTEPVLFYSRQKNSF